MQKAIGGVLGGGVAAAFGLAFLIEMFLDGSIKRPSEIRSKVGLQLFLSIPQLRIGGKHKRLKSSDAKLLAQNAEKHDSSADKDPIDPQTGTSVTPEVSANGELTPWDPRHLLRPFSEALRDNLITFFEINNLTHKPKLIAVTSCSHGAGVSTIASGLAASLSETGDGNVLVVDMNQKNGAVHQFYKGELTCDLDDVLEQDKRSLARVNENLYVATEQTTSDQAPVFLPKRFKDLVPRLRASDYDYIIFDMPPINQISPTQRLARFMDIVLMVVESEKTGRDAAKMAGALLKGTKTNVGAVLNKTRSYGPQFLQEHSIVES